MTAAALLYREVFIELIAARERRGPLTEGEEARFVQRLRNCWDQMTPDEQVELIEEGLVTTDSKGKTNEGLR